MNLYIQTISQTIDYIEEHIGEKLTLQELSNAFNISEYHFNRIFKTVVGKTLKQYILERKLTHAHKKLIHSKDAIIDIAYTYGFEYPEVFSRAYKKYYGMAPIDNRKNKFKHYPNEKAQIVERDLLNYGGGITVKGEFIHSEPIHIIGISAEVNENDKDFDHQLRLEGINFLNKLTQIAYNDQFYSIVNCHDDQQGIYTLFSGVNDNDDYINHFNESRVVPEGWYVVFTYYGDMVDMKETFVNDLYRWLMINEVKLLNNGIGMFNIYEKDYLDSKRIKIRIPIDYCK